MTLKEAGIQPLCTIQLRFQDGLGFLQKRTAWSMIVVKCLMEVTPRLPLQICCLIAEMELEMIDDSTMPPDSPRLVRTPRYRKDSSRNVVRTMSKVNSSPPVVW